MAKWIKSKFVIMTGSPNPPPRLISCQFSFVPPVAQPLRIANCPTLPSSFTWVLLYLFPPGCLLSVQLGILSTFSSAGEDRNKLLAQRLAETKSS